METHLRDRVVWITGASGGIGAALARRFGEEGARLVLHGHRNVDAVTRLVDDAGLGDRALVVSGDVADPADVDAMASKARERFGRIDVAVANAGIWPAESIDLTDLPDDRVRRVIDVNLLGVLWTARAFLRAVRDAGRDGDFAPSLILIGSTAGVFGERGHCEYAASKAALSGVMKSLKNEIVAIHTAGRVNLIDPGWTVTDMTRDRLDPAVVDQVTATMPIRRVADADDVANAALFLASPLSRHVSGQAITVAGGMEGRLLWPPAERD